MITSSWVAQWIEVWAPSLLLTAIILNIGLAIPTIIFERKESSLSVRNIFDCTVPGCKLTEVTPMPFQLFSLLYYYSQYFLGKKNGMKLIDATS